MLSEFDNRVGRKIVIRFTATRESQGFTLRLEESSRALLRNKTHLIAVEEWIDSAPSNSIELVAKLQDALATEPMDNLEGIFTTDTIPLAKQTDDVSVWISDYFVASATDSQAVAGSLPTPAPLTLQVDRSGPLTDPKTRLSAHWLQRNGHRVRPVVDGSVINVAGTSYRLPLSLFRTINAIEAFNNETSHDVNTRLAHLEQLKGVTGDAADLVNFEKRLSEIKLSHAHSFSLEFDGDPNSLNFSPVLNGAADELGKRRPLLNTAEQIKFSDTLFLRTTKARSSYFIDNKHYLFVSPELLPALEVVREVQQSDEETKREFLRSPAGYIRQQLEDRGQVTTDTSYVIDQLFHETDQYSDRVSGIGLWEPSKESEIEPGDINWIPEGVEHEPPVPAPLQNSKSDNEEERSIRSFVPEIADNIDEVEFDGTIDKPDGSDHSQSLPAGLVSTLKDHQKQGLVWLQLCWQARRSGALLADDMGVGKTIQAIAFLRWLQEHQYTGEYGPIMVVAPVSLLDNWQNEIELHLDKAGLGKMALLYAEGLKQFRLSTQKDIHSSKSSLDTNRISRFDLLLTTYETLRDYSISLGKLGLSCIVFDEMQKVKNPGSLITRASKSMNARFSIGLTGTPIENTVADLWCMLDTLVPGSFGSRADFLAIYGAGATEGNLLELGARLMNPTNGEPAYLLRRLKSEIGAELPRKRQKVLTAVMPSVQQNRYDQVLRQTRPGSRNAVLEAIQNMRAVSLHPYNSEGTVFDTDDAYIAQSARMTAAFQALDEINRLNEKALLFVENLAVAAHLVLLIRRRYKLSHTPDRIYGATPARRRQQIVDRFSTAHQGEFDVLVLSPKAAGVGLNIVAANHVIHLTRWWNPAVEDQCTDRAYRIKQDKPVTVYLPQSTHAMYPKQSFDELLHEMLETKRAVAKGVLMPGEVGNEATQLLQQLSATLKESDNQASDFSAAVKTNDSGKGFTRDSLQHTLYPEALQQLLAFGVRQPEIGLDIAREDGAIFTTLEWAWPDVKVGLADMPCEEERLQLERLGWKTTDQSNDYGLECLRDWLR